MTEIEPSQQTQVAIHAPPSAFNLLSNPILRRYRRSQMRPVRLAVAIVLTLVIAGFIATMAYLPLKYRGGYTELDAARAAFLPLLVFQFIILAVIGTSAIGSGILKETEEGMIEYQRLTPLSPLAKVLGYLFGLPSRQYVAFGITAVFSGFSIVVGEIPYQAWGSIYLVLFASTLLYHLLGLITGLIIKNRWRAGLSSIGLVILINIVLPRLADFGFAMFSHLTIWPVVGAHFSDIIPTFRGVFSGWAKQIGHAEVPFWNFQMSHLAFSLMVQGSLILTFIVILVRRWRDEQAHLLGKGYAVAWLIWMQVILLGNVLPLLDKGRILTGMLGKQTDVARTLSQMSGTVEAQVLIVLYGIISLLLLKPVILSITPQADIQMVAFRRQKKFGQRGIPWLSDGASALPWIWLAAGVSGAAWAVFVQRMLNSGAFGPGWFPTEGWAVFIGIVLVLAAIFHFLIEGFGRRVAWLTFFLIGFVPLFTSLVLISISGTWLETARYLTGLSPLSAVWQPAQWLEQWRIANGLNANGKTSDFAPFILFCSVHVSLCMALFIAWRRKRISRAASA